MRNKKSLTDELFNITYKKRIPLYTILETTYSCNLSCKHCYIPNNYRDKKNGYLSTNEIKGLLKEIASLGGLYVVFTGGEPLLRKDIFELIKFAKKLNFYVILFTNGSLINKYVAKKLSELRINRVEISLYGNKEVHNSFVGGYEVFDKVVKGIKFLKDENIEVFVKTVINKENFKQHKFLNNFCKKLGVGYKFDFVLTPKNDGNMEPTELMLEEKEVVSLFREYKHHKEKTDDLLLRLTCSAGMNVVGINPFGEVYPCLQLPYKLGSIKGKSFSEIWLNNEFFKIFKEIERYKGCKECELLNWCNRCPGLCFVESKSFFGCSSVLKKVAKIFKNFS
jgi:radical SAM protein with 4Fe4S-binding SPASM domain